MKEFDEPTLTYLHTCYYRVWYGEYTIINYEEAASSYTKPFE